MIEFYVSLIGITAGATGYLISTFLFQPILRYREIRSQIISDLVFYRNAIDSSKLDEIMKKRMEDRISSNLRHSADLVAILVELPRLYKYYITKRGINIQGAISELRILSSTFEYESAAKRIENIQKHLKIEPRATS